MKLVHACRTHTRTTCANSYVVRAHIQMYMYARTVYAYRIHELLRRHCSPSGIHSNVRKVCHNFVRKSLLRRIVESFSTYISPSLYICLYSPLCLSSSPPPLYIQSIINLTLYISSYYNPSLSLSLSIPLSLLIPSSLGLNVYILKL